MRATDAYEGARAGVQRFVNALFDVYLEGDAMGRPFFFPKPNVHMTEKFFKTDGHQEFLNKICQTATEKGNTYFVFDRGGTAKISECCRLTFKLDENKRIKDARFKTFGCASAIASSSAIAICCIAA